MSDAKIIKFPVLAAPAAPIEDARRVPFPCRLRALRERGVTGPAVLQALTLQSYEKERRRAPGTTRLDDRVRGPTRRAIREETGLLLWVLALLRCDARATAEERDDVAWCLRQIGVAAPPGETLRWDRAETDRLVNLIWDSVPTMRDVALRA